ncbi:MAG TPA: hypothetical protein VER39_06155, partial [Nocardioidaceae bacterium]|nr:hypothetical protein [Nocardioidaceae bacterium]
TARAAARRRRRVLIALLACTAVTVVAAFLSFLPGWSTALPAGLTVAWLVLCRTTVRRESARRPSAGRRTGQRIEGTDAAAAVETPAEAIIEDAALRSGSTAVRMDAADEPAAPDQEDTVGIPVAELHAQLHGGPSPAQSRVEPDAAPDAPSGTLWDPLPVTLPTYVTAPKARRTVRTIDLGEPGTWTSGRTVQDAEIAARATESPDSAVAQDGSGEGGRRAVGS